MLSLCMVAPYAGAWIEIYYTYKFNQPVVVAPYAGAWIEIVRSAWSGVNAIVAPYAGAWIEIIRGKRHYWKQRRRSLRGSVD